MMERKNCLVTILLPTYNAGDFLKNAIQSILRQTYKSFEVLVLDDGSMDGSTNFLKEMGYKRIRLIKRKHNYISTLNYGLSIARGKYIARMDADDFMRATRIYKQVKIMEANPDVTICSSYMRRLGGKELINVWHSGKQEDFGTALLLGNFIAHPTVMIRSDFLRNHGLKYRHNYIYAEDYKLWAEMAQKGACLYVLPEPLLDYRISGNQVSRIHHQQQVVTACRIRSELLTFLIKQKSGMYKKSLGRLYRLCVELNSAHLLGDSEIFQIFYLLLSNIAINNECELTDRFTNQTLKEQKPNPREMGSV